MKWVDIDVLVSTVVARLDSRVLEEAISVYVDGTGIISTAVELVTIVAPVPSGSTVVIENFVLHDVEVVVTTGTSEVSLVSRLTAGVGTGLWKSGTRIT